jgi:hypothetical protein
MLAGLQREHKSSICGISDSTRQTVKEIHRFVAQGCLMDPYAAETDEVLQVPDIKIDTANFFGIL